MIEKTWVHVDFDVIVKMTEKAFLIRFCGHGPAEWIPMSQIENNGKHYTEGDRNGSMCISDWIANEKGLQGNVSSR